MPSKKFAPDTIYMTCDIHLLHAVRNATYREKWYQYGQDIQQTEALLLLSMPAKSNTNPAKTPIFTPFLSNSRLKYVQYVGVRLCQKSSKMAAFWLPASLTPMFLGKTRRASALILDV